ncbi:uncharacterized protein LOC113860762 [Abrus precatorius]|uniref:Uncharacterized protein LOC113860762 n=1 Tax=Abrus precatorius TaxID=3816 RepID=A0A8B8L335_ABRPR|nr:uncharacterized protein LOC113860762 [Abrus precatorius]
MRPPSRRVPTGDSSVSKSKERHGGFQKPKPLPTAPKTRLFRQDKPRSEGSSPRPIDHLLAGYLAHEFLTKGTLLGRRVGHSPGLQEESQKRKYERYVELTLLLKTDGPHMFRIANPAQLAHFLKL